MVISTHFRPVNSQAQQNSSQIFRSRSVGTRQIPAERRSVPSPLGLNRSGLNRSSLNQSGLNRSGLNRSGLNASVAGQSVAGQSVAGQAVADQSLGVYRSTPTPFKARKPRTTLRAMPQRMPLPGWLNLLKKTEKISLMLTFALVGGAVVTYGWAVYSQQEWGKNFHQLNLLRRDERQLLKSSELMKNDIARHNDPKQYGLVPRNSDHIVVIPPSPLRSALPTRSPGPDLKAKPITPIGY